MTKRIFPAVKPWAELEAEVIAKKEAALAKGDPMAKHYAGPEVYRRYYDHAIERLNKIDVLSLDAAADLMGLTPDAYIRKADRGQAVLIEMEGKSYVPRFTLNTCYKNARIKPFHVAVAKEFSESADHERFKFISYLKFMAQALEIGAEVPPRRLPEIFKAAGVSKGKARVIISVPMSEIIDRAQKNPSIMAEFINQMGSALTRIGGMGNPNEGGISDEFLARYVSADIPGRDRWTREFMPG